MNYPPTKRLRGLNQEVVTAVAFDDPFGDDGEFTQDDFDEIDIIASQAITSAAGGGGMGAKTGANLRQPAPGSSWSSSAGQSRAPYRATAEQSQKTTVGFSRGNAPKLGWEPVGNARLQNGPDMEESHRLLEAQHAELKRKLKEVEEEILLKSGEIRVLRDSVKTAQQQKEAERQELILLETQRQKEQSNREKELNKKVLSLQSELQFKEAEINEMKTKLHSSEKTRTSPLQRNSSPRALSSPAQVNHGSNSSPSSSGSNFLTKEGFGAQISTRVTPVKTSAMARKDDRGSRPDPFMSVRPAYTHHRGAILLGLLLQQPLSPSSLGISHLLTMNLNNSSQISAGFQLHADTLTRASVDEAGAPGATLSAVQALAVTGLNMLSQSQPAAAASSSSRTSRSCPAALLLLPLLDLHLSQLCQRLDSLCSATDLLPDRPVSTPPRSGKLDEASSMGFTSEDIGLAALRLLYLLLNYSDEVVEAVLFKKNQTTESTDDRPAARLGVSSQNALLQSMLRLCDVRLISGGAQMEELAFNVMKTLCVLVERTPHKYSERLQCVLQAVCACLSAESRLQTVSECVRVLTSMSDHRTLAEQLTAQHDPCVFLKLFQLIRTRPENVGTDADWISLNLQVVRLLSRLTQRTESWMSGVQSTCPCSTELVQTVVIVFHRQWLDLSGCRDPASSTDSPSRPPWWSSPAASLLRVCLLLLHWMLLNHGSFSESCRPLLHKYDQMIPAVRDTLRKIPELSESEELALEEICRSDGDDGDDMDTDTCS